MKNINQEEVRNMYNQMNDIWPENDKWYVYTNKYIQKYLDKFSENYINDVEKLILNAGSAGNTYGIPGKHFHIDIAENHIRSQTNSIACSIEDLPFRDNYFDICICVGSVINYCDAIASISEIYRVLKQGGLFVLEYDQSKSYEFLKTNAFNKNATIIKTFNSGNIDNTWVFSERYIDAILKKYEFSVITKEKFHCLSPLLYKITKNENKSSKFARLDKLVSYIPVLNSISSNIILTAQKT